ncbi:hypothetical protein TPE_2181 [Treponema pedis str. T A4]|uniref:Uncharacterized protein n=1 Tax=Treponema pedis str. T A4 TaxID=1291379 RepID=S5ZWB2_9SPIR|nr:hypothetical protein TPE_2181 [Treponema pedis str. T A4]
MCKIYYMKSTRSPIDINTEINIIPPPPPPEGNRQMFN